MPQALPWPCIFRHAVPLMALAITLFHFVLFRQTSVFAVLYGICIIECLFGATFLDERLRTKMYGVFLQQ